MNVLVGGASWFTSMANTHLNKIVVLGLVNALLARYFEIRYVGFGKTIELNPEVSAALEIEGGVKERPQGATEGRKLSILSHNVWCHYGQQWYAPSARKRLTCLQQEIIDRQYDVVMLQELFMLRCGPFAITSNFENLVLALQRHGYHSITDPRSSLPFFGQNSGLVILSRLPLLNQSTQHLFKSTSEKVCNKGFVHAQLSLGPSSELHIVNTHLDSKNKPKTVQSLQSKQIRTEVLDPLLAMDPTPAILVGGDWNVCSRKSKDQGEAYADLSANLSPLRDAYGGAQPAPLSAYAPATPSPGLTYGKLLPGIFGEDEFAPTRRPNTKPWVRGKKKGKEGGAAIDHAFFTGISAIMLRARYDMSSSDAGYAPTTRMECVKADLKDLRCEDLTVVSDHLGMDLEMWVPARVK